ncbi:Zinc finger and SCAN domain-containing protein 22 [Eumeta japonica]|uniref:Zinc finger and SCAN domain-containing protein 22 n=1 Tax=Eumeta variegata TaxID=151549 RepID=A0A4C1WG17_EUMVA|nr:Zinc finger and SCAN domain-containing protein 22 [Eumeta japonica]
MGLVLSDHGQMTCHMSTHTGARPYTCDECGVSVTKPNSLKKHKLIHLGIRPFECDACPMRFTCKDHLKRHYRIHTGEKPYKCKFCDRAFTQSNDLAKHLRSHIGQNIYQCTVCDKRFRLLTELKQHYPTHYVDGEIPEEKNNSSVQKQSIIIPADSNKPEISITFDRNLIDTANGLPTSITIGICNDKS